MKRNSESIFLSLYKFNICSICYSAHIKTFDFSNKGWSIAIAVCFSSFKLFRFICIGGMQTSSFTKPHKKKSRGGQIWRSQGLESGPPPLGRLSRHL